MISQNSGDGDNAVIADQSANPTRVHVDDAKKLLIDDGSKGGIRLYLDPNTNEVIWDQVERQAQTFEANSPADFVALACNKKYPRNGDNGHQVLCLVTPSGAIAMLDGEYVDDQTRLKLAQSPLFDLWNLAFNGQCKPPMELADMLDQAYLRYAFADKELAIGKGLILERTRDEWGRVAQLLRTLHTTTRRTGSISATATRSVQSVSRELMEEVQAKDGNELVQLPEFGNLWGRCHEELAALDLNVRIVLARTEDGAPPLVGFKPLGVNQAMFNDELRKAHFTAIVEAYNDQKKDGTLKREMIFA